MYYTGDALAALLHGALRFDEKDGALCAVRMEDSRVEAVRASGTAENRCFWGSGVFFEFDTRASSFSLDFDVLETQKGWYKTYITVLENGVMTGEYPFSADLRGIEHAFKESEEKHVEIWFPIYVRLALKGLLCDGATPVLRGKKLAFFGDSITQGYSCAHPHLAYASQITRRVGAEAINYAIGGYFYDPAFLEEALSVKPDAVIISFGTNDHRVLDGDKSKFARNLEGYYDNLQRNIDGAPIFTITPIWRADREDGVALPWTDVIKRECAKHKNVTVIDGYTLVPHDTSYFADLRLHPNDKGMCAYADALYDRIKDKIL